MAKARKELKWWAWTLIGVAVMTVIVTGSFFGKMFLGTSEDDVYRDMRGVRPDLGESLALVLPAASDTAGLKQFAYELYTLANTNFQTIDNAAYAVNSRTTTMNTPVYGYRYFVKNQDRLLYLEYSFVSDSAAGALVGAVAKDSTRFAERCYTDASLESLYAEKTLEPTYTLNDEGIVFDAKWDNLYYAKQKEKPAYYKDQEGEYEQTDQKITPETIKTVLITYFADKGYYRMELELDVTNPLTTSKTLPNLRANSGAANANYTSMFETIEIWDNGYFKYFLSEDHWEGDMGGILHLSSDIRFETDFLYDEYSTDFSRYQYADELIDICKNGKMQEK